MLASLMVAALALLILAEILASSLFGLALEFAFEYGAYLLILIIFAGAAETLRVGDHIRVSLVLNQVGPRTRHVLELLCTALALGIAVFVAIAVSRMTVNSIVSESRSYLPSQTLLGYPQLLLAIFLWLFVLQLAARLLRCITGMPIEPETQPDDGSEEGA